MLREEERAPKIMINHELCRSTASAICVLVCPFTASIRQNDAPILEVEPAGCISSGHCAAICPSGALTFADFPEGTIHLINLDLQPSAEHILELLRTRRSTRAFTDTPVERDLIEQMIEGARFSPSAHNVQSTEFVVVENKATLHKITELTAEYLAKLSKQLRNPLIRGILSVAGARDQVSAALPMISNFEGVATGVRSGHDEVLFGASYLLLFHARRSGLSADVNANLALHNAALMCEGLGVGCFYAGYVTAACDRDTRIQKLLQIPDSHKIYAALAFGDPKYRFKQWMERNPPKMTWI